VAEAEVAGQAEVVLRTGNVQARRDFTDVRDVVRAYAAGPSLPPGAYNVCSGRSTSVLQLIEILGTCARIRVRHEVDPARLRPHDVPDIRGSAAKLRTNSGWEPEIPLDRTVADALEAWRARFVG
jgi:GDP-4-dehydro-6-deoxy-D-mannose reductase